MYKTIIHTFIMEDDIAGHVPDNPTHSFNYKYLFLSTIPDIQVLWLSSMLGNNISTFANC